MRSSSAARDEHVGDGGHDSAHPGARRTRLRSMSATFRAPHRAMARPQLGLEPAQQRRDAVGAAGGQRPQRGPAHQHGSRAERERLHDVGSAPHAAVDVDLGPPGHRVDDLGEDVGRRRRVGQLAGAVVRDDDRRCPGLDAAHGRRRRAARP